MSQELTPYDTGARCEPSVWEEKHRESDDDYGKVDFNTDEDYTVATLWIERRETPSYTGYVLKGHTNEPLGVDFNDQSDGGQVTFSRTWWNEYGLCEDCDELPASYLAPDLTWSHQGPDGALLRVQVGAKLCPICAAAHASYGERLERLFKEEGEDDD